MQTGPRLVATFIRSSLHAEIERAAAESHLRSNLDKIGQFSVTIPTLNWEQAVRIVAGRLDASKACKQHRQFHAGNLFWPLTEAFVDSVFRQNKLELTPRHLVRACAVEFDRLVNNSPVEVPPAIDPPSAPAQVAPAGAPAAAAPTTSPKPAPMATSQPTSDKAPPPAPKPQTDCQPAKLATDDEFQTLWNKRRGKMKPQAVKFDDVMGILLPWLVEATARPFARTHDINPKIGDVNLVFRSTLPGAKPLGVSFCNQDAKSLRWRLERLQKQWAEAKNGILGSMVVLRYSDPKPTAAAMERINALTGAGARTLFLSPEQLMELATLHEMLIAAQTGLLTAHGKPVEVGEYTTWARGNLPASVKDFLGQVFDQPAAPPSSTPPAVPQGQVVSPAQPAVAPVAKAAAKKPATKRTTK